MAPKQKPGKSKQDYQTPPEFLAAVRHLLGIDDFCIDLAASADNAVCGAYITEEQNALDPERYWSTTAAGWAWLNPPYANISHWVEKAWTESRRGTQLAMLLPASVGANWWRDHVDGKAYVLMLNGRLTFVGETTPYPKDCALLLYAPFLRGGGYVWDWRNQ